MVSRDNPSDRCKLFTILIIIRHGGINVNLLSRMVRAFDYLEHFDISDSD